jgi:hypothetical protein
MLELVTKGMSLKIQLCLEPGSGMAFWVMRDEDLKGDEGDRGEGKGEIVAYVEWEEPKLGAEAVGGGDGQDGRLPEGEVETPQLKKRTNLPEGTNVALLHAFQEKINALRMEVITDQSYYCTLPPYLFKTCSSPFE